MTLVLVSVVAGLLLIWIVFAIVYDLIEGRKSRARALARAEPRIWYLNAEARLLYTNAQVRLKLAQAGPTRAAAEEAVLLGPVSAWVAEGEARAIREWGAEATATRMAREPWS